MTYVLIPYGAVPYFRFSKIIFVKLIDISNIMEKIDARNLRSRSSKPSPLIISDENKAESKNKRKKNNFNVGNEKLIKKSRKTCLSQPVEKKLKSLHCKPEESEKFEMSKPMLDSTKLIKVEPKTYNQDIKGLLMLKPPAKKKQQDLPVTPPLTYKPFKVGPKSIPFTGKKYMGCHVSAAGGVWNSFENGIQSQAKSIAMFLRNQRSWDAKPLDLPTVEKWNSARKDFPSHLILPHGSYLMNLGCPKEENLKKSRALLVEELQRCEMLGIPHFNFHPGSSLGQITRAECCEIIAESINFAHAQTKEVICVIENMSKQGFTIGGDFNEIRYIIEHVKDKTRVGVCLDTCHSHAAGFDLSTEKGFNTFLGDFEKCIGWQFLRGLHINDSKGKSGDHLDRHENIGKGTIGIEGFRRIMNCSHFNDLPLILETPFVDEKTYAKEIALLESLIST